MYLSDLIFFLYNLIFLKLYVIMKVGEGLVIEVLDIGLFINFRNLN